MSEVSGVRRLGGRRMLSDVARPDQADAAVRAVAVIGLLAVGIIHALEFRGQIGGAAWLAAGFGLLAVTAPACALWLLVRPGPLPWLSGGLMCLSAGLGYVLTRSVALPGDRADVGNWLEPLGVTSLIIEAFVVILAASVIADMVAAIRPGLARAGRARLTQARASGVARG
jgi:hypothetical protein